MTCYGDSFIYKEDRINFVRSVTGQLAVIMGRRVMITAFDYV
jgi:hypothetical protein